MITNIPEDTNHYCYEWFYIVTKHPCYVGEGSGGRVTGKHEDDLEALRRDGLVDYKFIEQNLTKGQAESVETYWIKRYRDEGFDLLNKKGGNSSSIIDIYEPKQSIEDNITSVIDGAIHTGCIKDKPTPDDITNEIIDGIINTSNFSLKGKKWVNVNCRHGEMYPIVCKKVGFENIRNNMTMIDKTANLLVFQGSRNMGEAKMNDVLCINENFNDWETNKKFDIIIMNPPFNETKKSDGSRGLNGEGFILKCIDLLKDGGYLGVVMSQYWRTFGRNESRTSEKAYNQLRTQGGFHMIHMYSKQETADLFKQAIGQVDTFVWQKGATITNTKIINQNGVSYEADLNKYPQAPPVLPPFLYDQYFDQVNGVKWLQNTALRNKGKHPTNFIFWDSISNKMVNCNEDNFVKTNKPKIFFDLKLDVICLDQDGDITLNCHRYYPLDGDYGDKIIKSLKFIKDNGYLELFTNKDNNLYIPGIKVSDE